MADQTDHVDRLRALLEPLAGDLGLEVFDLEHAGGVLRVALDGPDGVDIDKITAATRLFSRALDADDPIPGRYTLEVSSPGLERKLRTPDHWRWAVGRDVSVKTVPGHDGPRRARGRLEAVEGGRLVLRASEVDGVAVPPGEGRAALELSLDDVAQGRTVFDWGPPPRQKSQKRVSAR